MSQTLVDTFVFKPTIVEASESGKFIIEGLFQKADTPNRNGRTYPRSIWERILNAPQTKSILESRGMLGAVDHPPHGKSLLKEASHVITSLFLKENGDVIGRAEVLNTPDGKIIQELCRANTMFGISSRGSGSVKNIGGVDVVQEDYQLDTFDLVTTPSTPGAYPKVVSESVEDEIKTSKENSMTAREKFTLLEQKANDLLKINSASGDEGYRSLASNAAADLVIELTKLKTESAELDSLVSPLIEEVNKKRSALRQPLTEQTSGSSATGFRREVPKEAKPGPGEGWALNTGDAGPLAGGTAGVDEFMTKERVGNISDVVEDEDESDNEEVVEEKEEKAPPFFAKKKEDGKEDEDEDDEDDKKKKKEEVFLRFAEKVVNLPETAETKAPRALAAAFLLEHTRRRNEVSGLQRVVEKLQERFTSAVNEGQILVVTDNVLVEKYEELLGIVEDLEGRHRMLAAKLYTEQALEKLGIEKTDDVRKKMDEAIAENPTRKHLDEVIIAMGKVTGFKPEKKEVTESIEGKVAKLSEEAPKSRTLTGPELAVRLSESLESSRSK